MSLHRNSKLNTDSDSARADTPVKATATPPAPANTPVIPSSNSRIPSVPKGPTLPPKKPTPTELTPTGGGSLRALKFLPPFMRPPIGKSGLSNSSTAHPFAGQDKPELEDVDWTKSPLEGAGRSSSVHINPMSLPDPVEETVASPAVQVDPTLPGLRGVIKEHFPKTPTPPKDADNTLLPVENLQNTPPVVRRAPVQVVTAPKAPGTAQGGLNALEELMDELERKYKTANLSQPLSTETSPLSSDNTVSTTMKALEDLLNEQEIRKLRSKPAEAFKQAPALAPIPKTPSRPVTPGSARSRAGIADTVDLIRHGDGDDGDVVARVNDSIKHRNTFAPNEGGQGLIRVVNVIPATTDALVPVRSKNFFGNFFGIYNNKYKKVNADNYREMLGRILDGSEDLLIQSKNVNHRILNFDKGMVAIALAIILVPELINMLQNNYSTEQTTTNIFLNYSLLVLLFVTIFANMGIAASGSRSLAAHERAEASAKTLEKWGQTALGIQLTEQDIKELRRRHSKSI